MPKINYKNFIDDDKLNKELNDLERTLTKYFQDNIDITAGNEQLVSLLIETFIDYYKVDSILQTEFKVSCKKHNSISISSLLKTKIQLRNSLWNYFNEMSLTPSARGKLKKLKEATGEDSFANAIGKLVQRDE